jgi:hypothetical protein
MKAFTNRQRQAIALALTAQADARYAESCERALAGYAVATALLVGPRVTDRTVIL